MQDQQNQLVYHATMSN